MKLEDTRKEQIYTEVEGQILAVLDGEENRIAQMATISCLLSQAFPETYFWTGFYIVDPLKEDELIVGPYQGTLGCLRIAFGRGVCGLAAQEKETQIVDDVHAHPNHIACDSRSQSEIVVPVLDQKGKLLAVFDVDSTDLGSFNNVDQVALERLMKQIFT
ncbi:GAF domain-containing protein [Temperatibacter marinus]|uniref:GAF domain-containing protein n=1 Tax=Temperatibacter marinus TaxID=1456591 RepID=A0AA52EFJ7_9PROT|nr:GAF domain-containing protein [Temperatibacter marinus]WND02758.1 GAF domain-containing protein [Temperatibacter marinus]